MVSLIVTNYNGENFIERCILSILNNSFKDIEVIIIDDASTDNSISVINSIDDDRIKLIELSENKGAGNARYVGTKIAKGDFIGFIDNDDFIEPDYIETLYNAAIENNSDMVVSRVIGLEKKPTGLTKKIDKIISANELLNSSIFSKRISDNIDYCKRRFGEDSITFFKYLYYANNPIEIDYLGYHYVENLGSLTHTASEYRRLIYKALMNLDMIMFKKEHPDCDSDFGEPTVCKGYNQIIMELYDKFYKQEPEATEEWVKLYKQYKEGL